MTDKERAIVMAYTGYVMLTGKKVNIFYDYVEHITGRTIELSDMKYKEISDEIRQKATQDFIKLCN